MISKWEAFLNDKELNSLSKFSQKPDGKYLFGKILHDLLHFLNGIDAWVNLVMQGYQLESMSEYIKTWMLN